MRIPNQPVRRSRVFNVRARSIYVLLAVLLTPWTVALGDPGPCVCCQWFDVGSGVQTDFGQAYVYDLVEWDDGNGPALYVGGDFEQAGFQFATTGLAKWNGQSWSALGSGLDGSPPVVRAVKVFDDGGGSDLYVGGSFFSAGPASASNIARWDGQAWSALSIGIGGEVWALAHFNDGTGSRLVAGGDFLSAGGQNAVHIAKWTGSAWAAIGTGLDGPVTSMVTFNDGVTGPSLYAAGWFQFAGATQVNHIARWNGSAWVAVGTGLDGDVHALLVYNDGTGAKLFAGGSFTNRLAKWNGSSWSSVGAADNTVYSFALGQDGTGPVLYATGNFTTIGGVTANRVAKFNGQVWRPMGATNFNGPARAMQQIIQGSAAGVYVGGEFNQAKTDSTRGLARYHSRSLIAQHPIGKAVATGLPTSLSVGACSTTAITYQWRQGGANVSNGNGISGATTATLSFSLFSAAHVGQYDVVVTDQFGSSTSEPATVALATGGNVRLSTHAVIPTAAQQVAFAAEDFNGDGRNDFAVATLSNSGVQTHVGSSNGQFQSGQQLIMPGPPVAMTAGHFVDSGNGDLIVTTTNFQRPIFAGVGPQLEPHQLDPDDFWAVPGTPQLVSIPSGPISDMPTLIGVTPGFGGPGTVTTKIGDGAGGYRGNTNSRESDSGTRSVAPGAFDSATIDDLAVANPSLNTVSILLFHHAVFQGGDTSGGICWMGPGDSDCTPTGNAPPDLAIGGSPAAVASERLNGDALWDIAVANSTNNTVQIWRGLGAGAFQFLNSVPIGAGARELAVADMDGDGDRDLVAVCDTPANAGKVWVLLNNGVGVFTTLEPRTIGTAPRRLVVTEFSNEGLPDVAVSCAGSNDVWILRGRPLPQCPGDVENNDDLVNIDDLLAVVNTWGQSGGKGDINGNGTVNIDDLLLIINGWGACP